MLSVYFPTQKRSKMRVTMSSRAVRPVSSAERVKRALGLGEHHVGRQPAVSASRAARTAFRARSTASA